MTLDDHPQKRMGPLTRAAPQAYGSTITYGRKLALTLLFNLTVSGGPQKTAEPPPASAPRLSPERQREEPPPWDTSPLGGQGGQDDHLTILKRAAEKSRQPATDKQIPWLADLLRKRGEQPEAVLEDDGSLSSKTAGQAIDARRGGRS